LAIYTGPLPHGRGSEMSPVEHARSLIPTYVGTARFVASLLKHPLWPAGICRRGIVADAKLMDQKP